MVVNNSALLFLVFVFSSSVMAANQEISQTEVLNSLRAKMAKATELFEDRIDFCEKQKRITPSPVLDKNFISSINVTREQVLVGLGYLYARNEYRCEGDLRIKLAYAIGLFSSTSQDYNLDANLENDISVEVLYPSIQVLEFEIKYFKLPENLRIYLEKTVSDKPFQIIEAMKKNGLSVKPELL